VGCLCSGVASPKVLGGANLLTLGEQQCFLWDTAFQSTKGQDILAIVAGMAPSPLGYAYVPVVEAALTLSFL